MIINKVEICGVNTSKLPVLKKMKWKNYYYRMKKGDNEAREKFIKGNLKISI